MYQSTRCHQTRKIFENPLWEDVFKKPAQVLFDGMNNYTDHLDERNQSIALIEVCERSSVRVSYSKDPQTQQLKILEENHTATLASFDLEILNFQSLTRPFGLRHSVYSAGRLRDFEVDLSNPEGEHVFLNNVTKTDYQYKYNGQEWQDELGLNMYAMDLRQYDPAIGRWVVMDPITHHSMSPYSAFDNNPVFWADPSGADAVNIGYDRTIDSQDIMGSVHWSGGFQEIENEGGGETETQKGNPSSSEQRASQDNGDDPPGKGEGLRKFLNTKIGKWGAKLGDMLSGGQVSDMEESLYLYETEGFDSYIYSQIGSATRDARYSMMGQYRGGKSGAKVTARGVGRIQAGSLKEFKSLVNQLSKPGSELTVPELRQLEKLTQQFGGKLRYDLDPVKGKILKPHVQVEGLGSSVEARHIWSGQGVN